MSDLNNEDISFKPLSEGLGFHQKRLKTTDEAEMAVASVTMSSTPASRSQPVGLQATRRGMNLRQSRPSFLPEASADAGWTQDQQTSDLNPLLGNEEQAALTPVWMQPVADKFNPWAGDLDIGREPSGDGIVENGMDETVLIDNPFFVPQKMTSPVEVVTLKFSGHDGLRKSKFKPALGSFTAIAVDVLTLSSILMIVTTMWLMALGESPSEMLADLPSNATQRSYLLGMVFTLGFMYLVLARCFWGRTVGEWMFHLQLGSNDDQESALYPLKVLLRTLLVFLTGFVLFPVLSKIVRKDVLCYFCGLEMHGEAVSPSKA